MLWCRHPFYINHKNRIMLTKMISFLLFVLFLIGLPILSMGQSQWNIPKLDGGILFDGLPDEEAWKSIIPFPFVTQQPNYSKEVESKTVVRMCFDDQYLYLGASMYVANSSMIRAIGKVRDFRSTASDWIGVQIDTYNDDQNAQVFLTNPNGICWDAAIFNDGTPIDGEPYNINWNTFWEVKTVIQDTIWHAEMKIPISSLRFESKNGSVVMGINVVRYQAANNQIYIFPDTPYKWGALSHIKPSTYADARFQGLKSKRPLYISPYLLVGASNDREISKQTTFREGTKLHIEPGLDIKYGINSHTTLDVTVNTDFSQVEADEQQFNLSRFSLVFPEKRKFFLERASVFDFGLGGPDQLFYSRRIGLHQGDPV
ncbi:MAG: DUF5916 domain-containing protein, partial [Prolixibacteraceae bacterium]|nr:DUF5916 domain-containing protein [Prolixibacteraceae bacterium]